MKKTAKVAAEALSPQVGVRISRQERMLLNRLIAVAEHKSGLAPGTISPASYVRSALIKYMAEAVRDLEAAGEGAILRGPTIYDRLRETVELMDDAAPKAKRAKRPSRSE